MPQKKVITDYQKQIMPAPKMPAPATITAPCHFLFALSENIYILIIVTTTKQPNAHGQKD